MTQKLIIGALAILIIGVIGFGVYSALPANTDVTLTEDAVVNQQVAYGQNHEQAVESQSVQAETNQAQNVQAQAEVTREPQVMAQDNVGDVWEATGTITELEDVGLTMQLADGSSAYVELGPPTFWQAQGVELAVGSQIAVSGWNNGEQIHARVVSTDNAQLTLRSESSQPLWSGGASNAQGQNGTQSGQVEFQVAAEDWVTVSGAITVVTNGAITMQAVDGTPYSLEMGQPNFWQSQGVTLSVGDEIEVVGFWMNGQFAAGDITKTATGEHIILRDPNGRQLWGGPGRNGASNGQAAHTGSSGS